MIVVYRSRKSRSIKAQASSTEPVLELSWNSWDDYGSKTTLNAMLHTESGGRELDNLKILVKGQDFTSGYFEKLIESGWDGIFPPPGAEYISNPSQISFYEEIIAVTGFEAAVETAKLLRDASRLALLLEDDDARALVDDASFRRSLLRERGDQQAFNQGWKLLQNQAFSIENLTFRFKDPSGTVQILPLTFASESLLPHDINVLIGPNGVGKSQLLFQLVEHWLQVEGLPGDIGFEQMPNLNRLIAISYSPFEKLRVDTTGLQLAGPDVYRYFGLRGRVVERGQTPPTLSLDHARQSAVSSLIACAADDQRYSAIAAWSRKIQTLHRALQQAVDFDFAAVEVAPTMVGASFMLDGNGHDDPIVEVSIEGNSSQNPHRRFVRIDFQTGPNLNVDALLKHAVRSSGVTLFRDMRPLEMSSGQRLFTYIVINLLGSIRRNSLVLIDEPELFLHPTLEIALISMLKTILDAYACKALIATHSLTLVREVPRDCVHVFEQTLEGLFIKHPPFQTFGGDIQRISSYVFGDKSVSKPFDRWIQEQIRNLGSREAVLERLAPEDLNEELLIELGAGLGGQP